MSRHTLIYLLSLALALALTGAAYASTHLCPRTAWLSGGLAALAVVLMLYLPGLL